MNIIYDIPGICDLFGVKLKFEVIFEVIEATYPIQ
jgi:hypothetical protein